MATAAFKTIKSLNPAFLAVSILLVSLMSTVMIFKATLVSWMSFVVILTFSSGMMTLFIYTSALASNEATKVKKGWVVPILLVITLLLTTPMPKVEWKSQSMKTFSSSSTLLVMAAILVVSIMAIASHGHHPQQTVSASF